jgi:hypothetical protein
MYHDTIKTGQSTYQGMLHAALLLLLWFVRRASLLRVRHASCVSCDPTVLAFCQGPEEPPRHTEPQPRGRPRRFSGLASQRTFVDCPTYMLKLSAYLTRNIINLPNTYSLLGLFITPSRHHADRRSIEYYGSLLERRSPNPRVATDPRDAENCFRPVARGAAAT